MFLLDIKGDQLCRTVIKTLLKDSLEGLGFYSSEDYETKLVGIRGGWIIKDSSESPTIKVNVIDQEHPRCSIVILPPPESTKTVRLFLAGTVPHIKYASESKDNGGQGANRLEYGLHSYSLGIHRAGTATGHKALIMSKNSPIRRTKNDAKYDNMDAVTFENPKDNIHAGWNKDETHAYYASAGCQCINGYPDCPKRDAADQWKTFWKLIENESNKNWEYILLPASVLKNMFDKINNSTDYFPPMIYGCQRDEIISLKEKLGKHYSKKLDTTNEYNWGLMQLVLKFQTEVFGMSQADAIVGKKTLEKVNEIIK